MTHMQGALLESADGGVSWVAVDAKARELPTSAFRYVDRLVWLSTLDAFAHLASVHDGYRTADGGQTWHAVPMPSEEWAYALGAVSLENLGSITDVGAHALRGICHARVSLHR